MSCIVGEEDAADRRGNRREDQNSTRRSSASGSPLPDESKPMQSATRSFPLKYHSTANERADVQRDIEGESGLRPLEQVANEKEMS